MTQARQQGFFHRFLEVRKIREQRLGRRRQPGFEHRTVSVAQAFQSTRGRPMLEDGLMLVKLGKARDGGKQGGGGQRMGDERARFASAKNSRECGEALHMPAPWRGDPGQCLADHPVGRLPAGAPQLPGNALAHALRNSPRLGIADLVGQPHRIRHGPAKETAQREWRVEAPVRRRVAVVGDEITKRLDRREVNPGEVAHEPLHAGPEVRQNRAVAVVEDIFAQGAEKIRAVIEQHPFDLKPERDARHAINAVRVFVSSADAGAREQRTVLALAGRRDEERLAGQCRIAKGIGVAKVLHAVIPESQHPVPLDAILVIILHAQQRGALGDFPRLVEQRIRALEVPLRLHRIMLQRGDRMPPPRPARQGQADKAERPPRGGRKDPGLRADLPFVFLDREPPRARGRAAKRLLVTLAIVHRHRAGAGRAQLAGKTADHLAPEIEHDFPDNLPSASHLGPIVPRAPGPPL
jgi:hypothetical protein